MEEGQATIMDFNELMNVLAGSGNGGTSRRNRVGPGGEPERKRQASGNYVRTQARAKLKAMAGMSRDATASIHDCLGMLVSAQSLYSSVWPEEYGSQQQHVAYLTSVRDAAFAIMTATKKRAVLLAMRAVVVPAECEESTIGNAAALLLRTIAEKRYMEMGLAALPPMEQVAETAPAQ